MPPDPTLRAVLAGTMHAHQPVTKTDEVKVCACGWETPRHDIDARSEHLADVAAQALAGYSLAPPGSAPPRTYCPHCDPDHGSPHRCSWGVRVAPDLDGDGQPTHLIVQPADGAHVAQADADWLWLLIRNRVCVHREPLPEPGPLPPPRPEPPTPTGRTGRAG